MKKSKFLKKSLAMLLAVMLVVAMIPLSAAAAVGDYEPIGAPELVASGDVSFSEEPAVSGNTITLVYNYDADNTPAVTIRTTGTQEKVRYLTEEGKYEVEEAPVEINLWEKDDAPADVTFWIVDPEDENNTSDAYTIKWSMEEPSSEATITSAKLDDISGVVNNADHTIDITVPYGYDVTDSELEIKTNDTASLDTEVTSFTGTVETNKKKGTPMTVVLRAQDMVDPQPYTITVKEADALTAISIDDVAGEIEIATADASDYDKGYETGTITFNMPAGTKAEEVDGEDQLMLVPTFTIGSAYKEVKLNGEDLKAGEEFNFAELLEAEETGLPLVITGPDDNTIEYTLVMAVDETSTEITGFTATDAAGFEATGTVSGKKLTAQISSGENAVLTDIDLEINAPAGATVTVGGAATTEIEDGVFTTTASVNCTKPVEVTVTSADESRVAYYTLTITKAEAANKNPQITSGKLTITNDDDTKSEYTASISNNTITFTVPYSTSIEQVEGGEYTWAKTSQTTEPDLTLAEDPFDEKAVNTAVVTSDGNDQVTYTVVFEKEDAKTGKSISDFVLTLAPNTNLMEVYEDYTYEVTASGDEFRVSMPQWLINAAKAATGEDLIGTTFTLSEGAKLYVVNSDDTLDPISSTVDEDTGDIVSSIDLKAFVTPGQKYVIADEYLAYEVGSQTLEEIQKTAKYDKHYTVYTVDATGTTRTGTVLNSLSADDGLVTSTVSGKKVTINVPYSYAKNGTEFFLDYTVSAGALLQTEDKLVMISGGAKDWEDGKMVDEGTSEINPSFKVVPNEEEEGKYKLVDYEDADVDCLYVVSEYAMASGSTTVVPYDIEIKVNAAETGALLTSVKVGNVNGVINNTAKTVTVSLPYGTNLGAQELTIEASKLAKVRVGSNLYTEPVTISLTRPVTITVQSENTATTNVYTLTATTAAQFSDVNTGDWFYQNVMDAVAAGIVSGRGDGTFGPNDRITRRDFAIMVSKLLLDGEDAPEATTTPFSDVAANDYGLNAIAYCAENGIISGFDGEFRPGDNITRQEAASVMKNALELTGTTSDLFADDAAIATWAKANVYACKAAGIFNGDDNNNFNPTSTLTRAEAASIMVNAMK